MYLAIWITAWMLWKINFNLQPKFNLLGPGSENHSYDRAGSQTQKAGKPSTNPCNLTTRPHPPFVHMNTNRAIPTINSLIVNKGYAYVILPKSILWLRVYLKIASKDDFLAESLCWTPYSRLGYGRGHPIALSLKRKWNTVMENKAGMFLGPRHAPMAHCFPKWPIRLWSCAPIDPLNKLSNKKNCMKIGQLEKKLWLIEVCNP